MKPSLSKVLVALIAIIMAAAIGGCGTVIQESATAWMQKQPNYLDP